MLAAAPWKGVYPPGLTPDVTLEAFPIHEVLERSARQWPDKPAITFRGHSLDYKGLKERVDCCAAAFIEAGMMPGERVAVLLPNTLYHPIVFMGAVKAGLTVVHVSPLDSERVMRHKLADSGARVLVTTNIGDLVLRGEAMRAQGIVDRLILGDDALLGPSPDSRPVPATVRADDLDTLINAADPAAIDFPSIDVDALALIQYTGGTTGLPKGAMLTHRNLSSAVSSYRIWFDAHGLTRRGEDKALLVLPLFHIYALTAVLLRGLENGSEFLLHQRFSVDAAMADIEGGATIFPGVPTMWIAIAAMPDLERRDFSSLRYCASGGAPLPVEIARKLKRGAGLDVLGGWGMTETSPAGTNIPVTRPDKINTIGVPLPGIHMDIVALDDPTRVLAQGETGELRIAGPNVTVGYLNLEADTRAAFSDGGLLTGDIGFMDEEGFFTIVDRKKDMIICGGFNVYPQMIEQAVYEHPDIEEALVIGIGDPYRGETPKIFAKLREGAETMTIESLRAFLKPRLGPHEMPTALEIRAALPRTPVGKLSKLELKREAAEMSAVLSPS